MKLNHWTQRENAPKEVEPQTQALYGVWDIATAVDETPQQINSWRTRWSDFPPPSYTDSRERQPLWSVQRATSAIRQIREYQRSKQR